MRWFIVVVVAFVVLISLYLGSAVFSISQLVEAARAGDGAAVIARTDVKALNRSLTYQIVGAYLQRIGATRRISPAERMLVNTYGASIADAMVSKMLTADRLTRILKSGSFDGSEKIPSFSGIAARSYATSPQACQSDNADKNDREAVRSPTRIAAHDSGTDDADTKCASCARLDVRSRFFEIHT